MKDKNYNNTVAVLIEHYVDSPLSEDAENLQYNLLGRGYKWPSGSEYINLKPYSPYALIVNILDKTLMWNPGLDSLRLEQKTLDEYACEVIELKYSTVKDVIQFIINPPKPIVVESVTPTAKLPVVEFVYPTKPDPSNFTQRTVRVVSMNSTYLKGYEITHPKNQSEGIFKQFRVDRIYSSISLISF